MDKGITDDLLFTKWVDGLQRHVMLRKNAFPELLDWCDKVENENNVWHLSDGAYDMISIFRKMNEIISMDSDTMDEEEMTYYNHVNSNMLYSNEKEPHLPIPVYSF